MAKQGSMADQTPPGFEACHQSLFAPMAALMTGNHRDSCHKQDGCRVKSAHQQEACQGLGDCVFCGCPCQVSCKLRECQFKLQDPEPCSQQHHLVAREFTANRICKAILESMRTPAMILCEAFIRCSAGRGSAILSCSGPATMNKFQVAVAVAVAVAGESNGFGLQAGSLMSEDPDESFEYKCTFSFPICLFFDV